ncbi:MAG: hypothetical protein ABIY71_02635, partial [Flavobacteriales bacterium]
LITRVLAGMRLGFYRLNGEGSSLLTQIIPVHEKSLPAGIMTNSDFNRRFSALHRINDRDLIFRPQSSR